MTETKSETRSHVLGLTTVRYYLFIQFEPVHETRTPRRSISHLHRAKSIDREIWFKGIGSRCVLEGHGKDNYYARFQTRSYL